MSSHALSAMSPRSALLRLSPFVLAIGALLLPTQARASCTTSGNVTTCTSSSGIGVSSSVGVSESSSISVTSLPGTVTAISVTLTNLDITGGSESGLNSMAIVLVPPSGLGLDFLSGVCGSGSQQIGNSTFTLADTGANGTDNFHGMIPYLGGTCPSTFANTYLPTDYFPGQDVFNNGGGGPSSYYSGGISASGMTNCQGLPGVSCGSYDFTTAFALPAAASSMQGTWTLYMAPQATPIPSGSLGSWSISFTTESAASTTTSIAASPNGSASLVYTSSDVHGDTTTPTPVTLTATVQVGGSPVTGGTVTFYDSTGTSAGMGTVLASGIAVTGGTAVATNVTFPGTKEGSRSISAVYSGVSGTYAGSTSSTTPVLTTNHPYNPSTGTFCNGPVTLSNSGAGTPYPSLLTLGTGNSQLTGTIESVTVSLNNISLQNDAELANLGFLLQAPGSNTTGTGSSGNAFQFLSWAGNPFSSGSLTMSDMGTAQIPPFSAPACSTCLPTDNWIDIGSDNPDTFPSPAPATFSTAAPTSSATFTTEFGGQGANNTWSLYLDTRVVEPGAAGTIGSWCMNFTMQANAHPTTTTVSGTPNPVSTPASTKASVALTANVSVTDSSGLTVNAGTVTFVDGTTNLGSGTVTNGVATLNTTLAEGTHQIVATYSGTNTGTEFGISTGKYDQRVNTATTNPGSGSGAGPFTYCNTGAITVPGLGADAGAASPYPSNIFVTNLPGTVDAVTVQLAGFSTKDQGDLLSLLVGPGGNNLDFFSLTGSNVSNAPPPLNLTFSDTASSLVNGNLTSSGTFKPTSFNTNITYPQCPPNAPNCASPPVGPPLASNPFTPTNKAASAGTGILGNASEAGVFGGTPSSTYNGNGTWSLYLNDGGPTGGGEASYVTGGWCVSLTENLPSVMVSKSHSGDFTQGQQGAPFMVNIKNNGPGPTGDPTGVSNPMIVTDTLNSALTYAGFSGTGWSCSVSGQTVTCKNDSAVADGGSYPELTIDVNVSATASTSITNQVSAIGAGVTSSTNSNTDTVTVIQVPASVTISAGNNQSATIGNAFTTPLSVIVKDANSVVIPSQNVTFTANPGSNGQSATFSNSTGTITVPTGTSGAADGVASASITANSKAGSYTVTATAGSVSATFNLTNTVGAPANIALTSGSGQSATIRTAFTNPLIATVTDIGGNAVPGATLTFTAPTGLASSLTFSNASTTISEPTNAVGQASSGAMTANGIPGGPYNVQASSGAALNNFQLTNLGKSQTTFASLTTTAATIDVFGFGFTAPSGTLAFTDVTTSTPVVAPVTLNTSTAATALTSQVTTSTGANTLPCWTELADVNGDGILDLITSLYNTDSVTVQLGNGDGTFKAATTYLIVSGFGPAEVHAVSLGSGSSSSTVDLIVGSFNVNQIAVLVGNGNGTFGAPTFYTVGTSTNTPTSLTAGDFNHDGNLDVATANTFNNNVSILLGHGNGTLSLPGAPTNVGRVPEAIRAGDFNGRWLFRPCRGQLLGRNSHHPSEPAERHIHRHPDKRGQRRGIRPAGAGHQRQREQSAAGGGKLQRQHCKRDEEQRKRRIRSTNDRSCRQRTGRRKLCRLQWRRDSGPGGVQLHGWHGQPGAEKLRRKLHRAGSVQSGQ